MGVLKVYDPAVGWVPIGGTGESVNVESLTQAEYDALATPDPDTLYVIIDAASRTVLAGAGAPSAALGFDGDFYINTNVYNIYGPKTAGAWGAPTSLVGPPGPANSDIQPIRTVTTTTDTLAMSDVGRYVRCTHASGCSITVPPNSAVAFPIGARIDMNGTQPVTLVAGSGVTINVAGTLVTARAFAAVSIIKVATDAWDAVGNMVP